jgi:sterol desaturase/sphingolipid hydroxylase (fatty acid hydroxylase superfamily)
MILGPRMHFYTFILWISFRITATVYGHSGYEFPWIPFGLMPLEATSTYHDFHHTNNIGNYSGKFIIWDTLLGSNHTFYKFL